MSYSCEQAAWIRKFRQEADDARQLVCFPHAGGAASYYFPLSALLAPGIRVLGVQYPGRQDRFAEPAIQDLRVLADEISARLADAWTVPPVLFGHSMGALLAYETAVRLETKHGIRPAALIVSGMHAPSRNEPRPGSDSEDFIRNELMLLGGIDPELLENEELKEMIFEIMRNDYRAVETYRPDPGGTVSCPLTAFIGRDDPVVELDDVRRWADHTTSRFALREFEGGHFYLEGFPSEMVAAVRAAVRDAASHG